MRKLSDIGNMDSWKDGQRRQVGAWSVSDSLERAADWELVRVRYVFHYHTLMGRIEQVRVGGVEPTEVCQFVPISTGWGSVSDQQGMNRIISRYGWYYRRAGGARYEQVS